MDTAIVVGVIMGSVVAIALVFGKTVLGVAWTGNGAKRLSVQKSGNDKLSKDTYNRISSHVDKSTGLDSFLNKEVSTCDNVTIGSISALQNGLMYITCAPLGVRYEIPMYFVRQYDQNSILVDISAGDLEHYRP